jgi:hypothetical protein
MYSTEHPETIVGPVQTLNTKPFPAPNASDTVLDVIGRLSTEGPESNLKTFTHFRTRRELTLPLDQCCEC